MKKTLTVILVSVCIVIIPFLFLSCSDSNTVNTDINKFPITKEIGNYIIDIEYTKLYKNSLITKYYITTKDGSNISSSNISVVIDDINRVIDYGIFPSTVVTENISNNKLVVVEEFFIVVKDSNFININYELGGNNLQNFSDKEKKIEGSYYINESSDGYKDINKKFLVDGINFTIQSITNFDLGSIINFYTYDTDINNPTNQYEYILDNYELKLKSGQYTKIYEIKSLIEYTDNNIVNNLISLGNYDKNMQYISFFQGNLIYNNDEVNTNDMQVYLVNKNTGEETLIYSN